MKRVVWTILRPMTLMIASVIVLMAGLCAFGYLTTSILNGFRSVPFLPWWDRVEPAVVVGASVLSIVYAIRWIWDLWFLIRALRSHDISLAQYSGWTIERQLAWRRPNANHRDSERSGEVR